MAPLRDVVRLRVAPLVLEHHLLPRRELGLALVVAVPAEDPFGFGYDGADGKLTPLLDLHRDGESIRLDRHRHLGRVSFVPEPVDRLDATLNAADATFDLGEATTSSYVDLADLSPELRDQILTDAALLDPATGQPFAGIDPQTLVYDTATGEAGIGGVTVSGGERAALLDLGYRNVSIASSATATPFML